MGHKKNLLVTAVPRTLREGYLPLIRELSKDFDIVVISVDFFTPPGFLDTMHNCEQAGTIHKFFLLPPYKSALKMLLMLKSIARQLKEYRFDIWLSEDSVQLCQRYLEECVVSESCVRVILWNSPTFLFSRNEQLVRKLLSLTDSLIPNGDDHVVGFNWIVKKIHHSGSIGNFLKKLYQYIKTKIKIFNGTFKEVVWRRIVLAKLVLGKTFRYEGYDKLTQMDSGKRFQHYIFCDEMEASAHKVLFQTQKVHVVQHLAISACRCGSEIQKKSAVLSPLSGFIQRDTISEKYLFLFYRDFKIVLERTGAKSIHLRMHPDETGRWYCILQDYLSARGMDVAVVDCDKPIHEVMCDYVGMAGVSSCALRAGRASCQQAFVVGFEAASKFDKTNPRFYYGDSEGIGWIREDGSYDSAIFSLGSYNPPSRKRIPDLLEELLSIEKQATA